MAQGSALLVLVLSGWIAEVLKLAASIETVSAEMSCPSPFSVEDDHWYSPRDCVAPSDVTAAAQIAAVKRRETARVEQKVAHLDEK